MNKKILNKLGKIEEVVEYPKLAKSKDPFVKCWLGREKAKASVFKL